MATRNPNAAVIARGWTAVHPPDAYLSFTQAGADLFA